MTKNKSYSRRVQSAHQPNRNCGFCRFWRALAFSGMGAWLSYYGAVLLGSSEFNAVIVAFFGALTLVLLTSDRSSPKTMPYKRLLEQSETEEE